MEDLITSNNVKATVINEKNLYEIPVAKSCIELISNTIAALPIKLYEEKNGKVVERLDDKRTFLLNDEPEMLFDGFQFKKNMVKDYLIHGQSYAYINMEKNSVKSIHYVDNSYIVSMVNSDPINKDGKININGRGFEIYNFISMLNNCKDGVSGTGVIINNQKLLSTAYHMLLHNNNIAITGGASRGIITMSKKVSDEVILKIKQAWTRLYQGNNEMVVLNDGMDYKQVSSNTRDMQFVELNEAIDKQIAGIFNIPFNLILGKGSNDDYEFFLKNVINPILKILEASLNKNLLLDKEKVKLFFSFDTKELSKVDIEKRYKAYEIALKNCWMSPNEIRFIENLDNVEGLDFFRMNLADVLFNPKDGSIYTPNTKESIKIN